MATYEHAGTRIRKVDWDLGAEVAVRLRRSLVILLCANAWSLDRIADSLSMMNWSSSLVGTSRGNK